MELEQLKQQLASENPQDRLRGLTALRHYEPEVAAPLLIDQMDDEEVLVRSFAAMGLGFKRTNQGFNKLLAVMQDDADPNVRAEAAAALGKHGEISVPYLVQYFQQDQHWLLRMSILLALPDLNCPEAFLSLCYLALAESEIAVQNTALEQLPSLIGTPQESAALDLLLSRVQSPDWTMRRQVALALPAFQDDRAHLALRRLRQDPDHRVVAATLEGLI